MGACYIMKTQELKLSDIQRILIGEVPASFFIELILRAAFIYFILMLSMRLMGKRMSSQISRNEMAAVVSLAAAVGIPLMNADRGILPAVIIAIVIIGFHTYIAKRSARDEKFEALTQDNLNTLVTNGVMNLDAMKKTRISRERLFAQLRSHQTMQLGSVKRFYLEANGLFSLVEENEPKPGLAVLPENDIDFINKMSSKTGRCVCYHCGYTEDEAKKYTWIACENCGERHWVNAVQ